MELIDRIRYIMKLNNLTASKFADEIGVQRSSMSHILSGRNKPSLDFVVKVLERFPNVSPAWLLLGKTDINPTDINLFTDVNNVENVEARQDDNKGVTDVNPLEILDNTRVESTDDTFVNSEGNTGELEKIVFFFSDGTFKVYNPRK